MTTKNLIQIKADVYSGLFILCGLLTVWIMIYLMSIAPVGVHLIILALAIVPLFAGLFALLSMHEFNKLYRVPKRMVTAIRLTDMTKLKRRMV